ncbi:MAG: DUF3499 family protein [Acidimicrobiia bacterium]
MFEACVRCGAAALAVMSYSYPARAVWLDDLAGSVEPGSDYALCGAHADSLSPPMGWTLADRRTSVRLFAPLEVA